MEYFAEPLDKTICFCWVSFDTSGFYGSCIMKNENMELTFEETKQQQQQKPSVLFGGPNRAKICNLVQLQCRMNYW